MKPELNTDDFCRASKRLSCDVAAIKTVADVESKGEGFYPDGFPTILFERHKFRSFTNGRYNTSHPQISGPAGNYGKAGQNQRNKFNLAFSLDPEAAMKSCSWGKFQIMGFNYAVCGFKSVGAFVDAMKESEGRQLDAFVSFVKNNGLADELRENDWAGFARQYNGADYKKNKYDTKMAAAYRKYAKEDVDCSNTSAVAPQTHTSAHTPTVDPQLSATAPPIDSSADITETKTTEVIQTGDTTHAIETTQPKGDPPDATATQVSRNGPLAKWLFGGGGLTMVGTSIWAYITGNANVVAVAIICVTALIAAIIFRGAITDAIRMQVAADPEKKNVS